MVASLVSLLFESKLLEITLNTDTTLLGFLACLLYMFWENMLQNFSKN